MEPDVNTDFKASLGIADRAPDIRRAVWWKSGAPVWGMPEFVTSIRYLRWGTECAGLLRFSLFISSVGRMPFS